MYRSKLTKMAFIGAVLLSAGCAMTPEIVTKKTIEIAQTENSYERGKYYLAKGYNGLALNHFKIALSNEPNDIPTLNAVAVTYQRLDRHDMAIIIFEKALNLNSSSPQTLNNIGYFYLSAGKPEESIKFFKTIGSDHEYSRVAKFNLKLAELKLEEKTMKMQASLLGPIIEPVSTDILKHASLERVSETVYVLNSKYSPAYENAIINMKLDPRLVVRSILAN